MRNKEAVVIEVEWVKDILRDTRVNISNVTERYTLMISGSHYTRSDDHYTHSGELVA